MKPSAVIIKREKQADDIQYEVVDYYVYLYDDKSGFESAIIEEGTKSEVIGLKAETLLALIKKVREADILAKNGQAIFKDGGQVEIVDVKHTDGLRITVQAVIHYEVSYGGGG